MPSCVYERWDWGKWRRKVQNLRISRDQYECRAKMKFLPTCAENEKTKKKIPRNTRIFPSSTLFVKVAQVLVLSRTQQKRIEKKNYRFLKPVFFWSQRPWIEFWGAKNKSAADIVLCVFWSRVGEIGSFRFCSFNNGLQFKAKTARPTLRAWCPEDLFEDWALSEGGLHTCRLSAILVRKCQKRNDLPRKNEMACF